MEAGQRNELKLVPHGAQLLLETPDRRLIQLPLPIERRGTIISEELTRKLGVNRLGKGTSLLEIRLGGLTPDQVRIGSISESPSYCHRQPARDSKETFRRPVAQDECLI